MAARVNRFVPIEESFNTIIGSGIYRDTGCEVAERCQECPLARCKDEMGHYERRAALAALRGRF